MKDQAMPIQEPSCKEQQLGLRSILFTTHGTFTSIMRPATHQMPYASY